MRGAHLSYEELEKYMDETDLSESYLCWSEQMTEHLDACKDCRERLEKLFLLSELWKEENAAGAIRLVGKEEELEREIVALGLKRKEENYKVYVDA